MADPAFSHPGPAGTLPPKRMGDPRSGQASARSLAPYILIILLVLALDQASKYWVLEILRLPEKPHGQIALTPVFSLSYVENRGVSFGLFKAGGAFQAWLLAGLALAITTLFSVWLTHGTRFWQNLGLSLAIGGALGNMVDRLRFHYVVDFLDFSQIYFPWVFNVADAGVSVGAGLLLFDLLVQGDKPRRPPPASGRDSGQDSGEDIGGNPDENASTIRDSGAIG